MNASFPIGLGWYCIYTAMRGEARAAATIGDIGFQTYAPTEPVWVRLRANSRRRVLKQRPLLPRYVFCQFDVNCDNWPAILQAEGVESILSTQRLVGTSGDFISHPIRIPERQMARLRNVEHDPEILHLAKAGDIMRIIGGPFAGHMTTLTQVWQDKYRARGNVTLFERPTPVDFDLADLESS